MYKFEKDKNKTEDNILDGKGIFALGSSIFYGAGSGGYSFIDFIRDHNLNTRVTKETVNGTTLANLPNRKDSYIQRLINKVNDNPNLIVNDDLLIVQLSTNDFYLGIPEGKITPFEDRTIDKFDNSTITGAIEYIISYAKGLNPDIKIAFISCPILPLWNKRTIYKKYNDEVMSRIIKKWNIDFLDLLNYECNDESYYKIDKTNSNGYFHDDIHPNKLGYSSFIYPIVDKFIRSIL